jgi:hypothetical protein
VLLIFQLTTGSQGWGHPRKADTCRTLFLLHGTGPAERPGPCPACGGQVPSDVRFMSQRRDSPRGSRIAPGQRGHRGLASPVRSEIGQRAWL